ncbi:unnamed protein product, partial [Sphacelaria rigidula]
MIAGLEKDFFMGRMGAGSWHELEESHFVGRLGTVWYTLSISTSSTSILPLLSKSSEGRSWTNVTKNCEAGRDEVDGDMGGG